MVHFQVPDGSSAALAVVARPRVARHSAIHTSHFIANPPTMSRAGRVFVTRQGARQAVMMETPLFNPAPRPIATGQTKNPGNEVAMPREEQIVSAGPLRYRAVADWARWPAGWQVSGVTAVATDSRDRVYVFNRGDHPVAVFAPDGESLFAWGEGIFKRPHGIW